jgi:hypothetical protein
LVFDFGRRPPSVMHAATLSNPSNVFVRLNDGLVLSWQMPDDDCLTFGSVRETGEFSTAVWPHAVRLNNTASIEPIKIVLDFIFAPDNHLMIEEPRLTSI